MENSRRIQYLSALVFLALLLPYQALSKTPYFERWVPLDQLLTEADLRATHMEALKTRFANSNMEEVLFVGQKIEGPRLSETGHDEMFKAIHTFVSGNPGLEDWGEYLFEAPAYQPFSVKRKKNIGVQTFQEFSNGADPAFALWLGRQIRQRVHVKPTGNVVALTANAAVPVALYTIDEVRLQIAEIVQVGKKSYSPEESEKLARLLLQLWMLENNMGLEPVRLEYLSAFESHRLEKVFFRDLETLGKELSISSSFMKQLPQLLGFPSTITQNFTSNAVVVYPMTRWYGMFKGIGPGECIRCSANRFFDAFMPHSVQFGILKDGHELGYIGIYKVNGKDSNRSYWYIDTIQSPEVANGSGVILTTILEQLQRMAMAEGAVLAVAPSDHNGTNFKENVITYSGLDSLDDETHEVTFDHSPINDAVFEFMKNKTSVYSNNVFVKSGYSGKKMYDTLGRNDYKVRPLAPMQGLSREEKAQYLKVASYRVSEDREIHEALEELSLYVDARPGPQARWNLIRALRENPLLVSNSERAQELASKVLFTTLSDLADLPFDRLSYFQNGNTLTRKQISKVQSSENADTYIEEMLPFCPTAKKCFELFNNYSLGLASTHALVHLLMPRLEELGYFDWTAVLKKYLKTRQTDAEDYILGEAVLSRLTRLGDLVEIVKISKGGNGDGVMGTESVREKLFLKYWEGTLDSRLSFIQTAEKVEPLLNEVTSATDVSIRRGLFARATEFHHIHVVMDLSNEPWSSEKNTYHMSIAKTFQRILKSKPDLDWETIVVEGEKVLNVVSSYYDVLVRQAMFERASSFEEIAQVISLSAPPSKPELPWYGELIMHFMKKVATSQGRELKDVAKEELEPILEAGKKIQTHIFAKEGQEFLNIKPASFYLKKAVKKSPSEVELDDAFQMIHAHYESSFFDHLRQFAEKVKKKKKWFAVLSKPRKLEDLEFWENLTLERAVKYLDYTKNKHEVEKVIEEILVIFRVPTLESVKFRTQLEIEVDCEVLMAEGKALPMIRGRTSE